MIFEIQINESEIKILTNYSINKKEVGMLGESLFIHS
jgi:hypothetical protein